MITLEPVGIIYNSRKEISDDYWGNIISEIELSDEFSEEALDGIEEFSHAEIIFYFNKVQKENIKSGSHHPRNNANWPKTGIFAQRGKNRPNTLGLTIAKIISRKGKSLFVKELDAIDGTPVLDIKPLIKEFLPDEKIVQPLWATELMRNYWKVKN